MRITVDIRMVMRILLLEKRAMEETFMKNVILGIDTGGTYTDGVLIESETKKVIRVAKAFTTKGELIIGIRNCIDALKIKEEHVCLVCLSTTLATNAVVEDRQTAVGLITIGDPKEKEQNLYPAKLVKNLSGKIDITGREVKPLDFEEIKSILKEMEGNVETLAISGIASIKNPQHELMVKSFTEEILKVPVVCAHELTTLLGFYERTVTAALNARLIPLIHQLLLDTEQALKERGIYASISVIKGDGHSMLSDYAKTCPVETVLSGPAASLMGGKFLTGEENAILIDMGGTTTDIVCVDNGEALLEKEGMSIEGWKTRVQSARVYTYGLGGDSQIRMNAAGKLTFGPNRVIPFCVGAARHPHLVRELKDYPLSAEYVIEYQQPVDAFIRMRRSERSKGKALESFGVQEKRVLELLEDQPHTAVYLAAKLQTDMDSLGLEKLCALEMIEKISLTPTDLLHAEGLYEEWNKEAALLGVDRYAEKMGCSRQRFLEEAEEGFVDRICLCIKESLWEMDGMKNSEDEKNWTTKVLSLKDAEHFCLDFKLKQPIVGMGAPARTWLKRAAGKLQATFLYSEHSAVASAIGAAIGDARECAEALICYDQHAREYIAYLPNARKRYKSLEEAKCMTESDLRIYAEKLAARMGLTDAQIQLNLEDYYIDDICTDKRSFVRSAFTATVKGELFPKKM